MGKDAAISLRLPGELKDRLQQLADADDRTLSAYIVRLLQKAAAEEEKKNGSL